MGKYYFTKDGFLHGLGEAPDGMEALQCPPGYELHLGDPPGTLQPPPPPQIALNYADQRWNEYPDIRDQLDAIWKGGAEMEAMRQRVLSVKAKYPKA